ncbi:MAG TPA: Calx-beta domain-containing protein [Thermoanaerobaculia bacterium]|nr:Calx-beta domain-containing protein [Thermoanaerobaculia bacterium]
MRSHGPSRALLQSRGVLSCLLSGLALLLSAGLAGAEVHEVLLVSSTFQPADLTIQVGDSVRFRNMDTAMAHNVRADDSSFRCANGCDTGVNPDTEYDPGAPSDSPGDPTAGGWEFTRTFSTSGQVPYHCEVHGAAGGVGMSGRIVVQSGGGGTGSAGQVRFTSDRFTVSESGGVATVSVERVGGTAGAVEVTISTGGGTASPGVDYQPVSQAVSWADGAGGTRSIEIPILDDQVAEGTETVGLSLSNPTGGLTLGAPATAELRILDDDGPGGGGNAGTLRFEVTRLWTFEDAGELVIRVLREGGASGVVSATVTIAEGSATPGPDFTGGTGTLSWGNGDSSSKSIVLVPVDDGPGEGTEKVTLQLGSVTGGAALGGASTATVFLLERPAACASREHGLCLGGRFVAEIAFSGAAGEYGRAVAVTLTADSGYFTFFDQANVEAVVKVLAACPINGHFWVFGAGLTDVEADLSVVDTATGEAVVYSNPAGTAFRPITDVEAFATCP